MASVGKPLSPLCPPPLSNYTPRPRLAPLVSGRSAKVSTSVVASAKKGTNKAILGGAPSTATGQSKSMKSRDWVDPQGRKGTVSGPEHTRSREGARR